MGSAVSDHSASFFCHSAQFARHNISTVSLYRNGAVVVYYIFLRPRKGRAIESDLSEAGEYGASFVTAPGVYARYGANIASRLRR